MAEILRDDGLRAQVAPGELKVIAEGFQFTEGPLWLPDNSLLFQDIKMERTYRLDSKGCVQIVREHTGAANGQTFAPGGRIAFCEQNGRRVSHMAVDGSQVEPLVEEWSGQRLNSPNDIVARSDGTLYFTDPAYGVQPADRALHFQGVYAVSTSGPNAGQARLLVDDFEKPNGLAFSPDERTLYVCDTGRYHVRAFEVEHGGAFRVGSGRVLAQMDPGQPGGPDGMKVDRQGRLYVAVALGVWVFEPDGHLLGILAVPKRPSNLAWCGAEGNRLAIMGIDTVYEIELKTAGFAPPFQPKAAS